MLRFTVRFDRYTSDNDDDGIACDNFPQIADPERRLLEQFLAEFRESKRMIGIFDVYHSQVVNDNLFCVWIGFEWSGTGVSFMTALQETYDVYGMSGFFEVLDVVGDGVDRKLGLELVRKWIAKSTEPKTKREPKTLVQKIAGRLSGIHKDDLTTAERQITDLLVKDGVLMYDDQGNVVDQDIFQPVME